MKSSHKSLVIALFLLLFFKNQGFSDTFRVRILTANNGWFPTFWP
jgi:hypothetical protein